jgi:hypothetical protein
VVKTNTFYTFTNNLFKVLLQAWCYFVTKAYTSNNLTRIHIIWVDRWCKCVLQQNTTILFLGCKPTIWILFWSNDGCRISYGLESRPFPVMKDEARPLLVLIGKDWTQIRGNRGNISDSPIPFCPTCYTPEVANVPFLRW